MLKTFIAACACLLIVGCSSLPAEFAGTDRRDYSVATGEIFGVAMGATREGAMRHFHESRPQFHFIYSTCLHQDFTHDNAFMQRHTMSVNLHQFSPTTCSQITEDVYHANSGLTGYANIFVDSQFGKVIRVKWGRGQGYIG